MKRLRSLLPFLAALALGLLLGLLLPRFLGGGPDEGSDPGEAAAEIWTCSMHPNVQAPRPGLCPICAMDLIPLSELGPIGEGRRYSMSETARALASITTSPVERRYPEASIRLYGSVAYDETRQESVSARFPARIDRLFVDFTGIRVKAGDHLATLYSPELLAAQSELLTAKRFGNEPAQRGARDKLRLWGFSDERIAEIEASGASSDQLTLDAPASGIVTERKVVQGDYVETGTPLFRINTLEHLWVVFEAYESDKPWLRYGQEVEFTAEALPGQLFEGRIAFLSPELDPRTRTFRVRVNVDNPDETLKPGMFVRGTVRSTVAGAGRVVDPSLEGKWISPMHPEIVKDAPGQCDVCGMDLVPAEELGYTVAKPEGAGPLVVPASAVLHTGVRSLVYVEDPTAEDPTYEGREILLGPRAGDVYLVEAGLREGERVVVEGAFAIDSALQIQAKPSMMLPDDDEEAARLFVRFEAGSDFLAQVDALLARYFELQLALAGDDLETSLAAAAALAESLALDTLGLEPEAAEAWFDLRERLEAALEPLLAAEDLETARVPFEPLSEAADELVRRFGTLEAAVYVAHCPMAFSNRGADWLQGDDTLLNPYFGASMLRCGDITEQIAGEETPEQEEPDGEGADADRSEVDGGETAPRLPE